MVIAADNHQSVVTCWQYNNQDNSVGLEFRMTKKASSAGSENRRVKMTKILLNDALMKQLEEKPLSRVTVKSICEYADINRSTYYTYYYDPFDQFERFGSEELERLRSYILDNRAKPGGDPEKMRKHSMETLLSFVETNRRLFNIFLGESRLMSFKREFTVIMGECMLTGISTNNRKKDAYRFIFVSSGCLGVIQHWLSMNCDAPIHDIADSINAFWSEDNV